MNGQQSSARVSSDTVSIPELLKKVNPEYGTFFKYIPPELLNDKQNASKYIAVKDEDWRLKANKCFLQSFYSQIIVKPQKRKSFKKNKNGSNPVFKPFFGGTPSGARTPDTLIKSQALYQLS